MAVGKAVADVKTFEQLAAHDVDVGVHHKGMFVQRALGQARDREKK